jgi:hypothetical protein
MDPVQDAVVEEETTSKAAAGNAEAKQDQGVDLNLNDLAALRGIIDVASQRGAFKAAELETVGKVFNKLNAFLEAATAKKD